MMRCLITVVGFCLAAAGVLPTIYAQNQDFVWAKAMGGTDLDYAQSIATDADGNVYTVGSFSGTADFDPVNVTPSDTLTSFAGIDGFLSNHDADGSLLWVKQIVGSELVRPSKVAVDSEGNVYTSGDFEGTIDFAGEALTASGFIDAFLSKHDRDGNLLWVRQIGGMGFNFDSAQGVAIDAVGNSYTAGFFEGTADFDTDNATPGDTLV